MNKMVPNNLGALNLVQNCINLQSSDRVLLVCEDPKFRWYDETSPALIAQAVQQIGASVTIQKVGGPDEALPINYPEQIEQHDVIVYLSRLGDQGRFYDKLPNKKAVMLYARNEATWASPYASVNHSAMKEFKFAVDETTASAKNITITCPLGTRLECSQDGVAKSETAEVSVERFPLSVPQPVLANELSGQVAIAHGLTSTGSQFYTPAICAAKSTVFADIERGRIIRFRGEADCVKAIETHYEFVATNFSIDKNAVHSWHAGIHPACFYNGNIEEDRDRWANNIFGSPRFVHFHTCGDYPPGEICWMVLDPTITLDGTALWEQGSIKPVRFDKTSAILEKWPELKILMSITDMPIGV